MPAGSNRKPRHSDRTGDHDWVERARRQRLDDALDEALKNTFPASDPVAIVQPGPPDEGGE